VTGGARAPARAAGRRTQALPSATVSESDGVRYLHLGTPWVQGAMRIADPDRLELEYVQRMMAWLLLRPVEVLHRGHAVQLGLGAGSITRFCVRGLRLRTTAVELNPSVIAACRAWFRLPADSARLQVLQMDAAAFAADPQRRASVDVLCVDLYDHEAASPVLDSSAFYRDCQALLAPGGALSVNLFGHRSSFERSAARIASAFGIDRVWSLKPTKEGNTVVLALKSDTLAPRAELVARAENIETRFALPAGKWLRMLRPWSGSPNESVPHPSRA